MGTFREHNCSLSLNRDGPESLDMDQYGMHRLALVRPQLIRRAWSW